MTVFVAPYVNITMQRRANDIDFSGIVPFLLFVPRRFAANLKTLEKLTVASSGIKNISIQKLRLSPIAGDERVYSPDSRDFFLPSLQVKVVASAYKTLPPALILLPWGG